jgi:serine/threonine protein kinase
MPASPHSSAFRVWRRVLTYIIMPYRREGSLATWLQHHAQRRPLASRDVAFLINQAADALQYAHDHQIVHQDVKPSNFLVRITGEKSHLPDLLLADFGIAKLTNTSASASHANSLDYTCAFPGANGEYVGHSSVRQPLCMWYVYHSHLYSHIYCFW